MLIYLLYVNSRKMFAAKVPDATCLSYYCIILPVIMVRVLDNGPALKDNVIALTNFENEVDSILKSYARVFPSAFNREVTFSIGVISST